MRWRIPVLLAATATAVAAALVLAGCAPPRDSGGPDPELRGQWELQSGKDAVGALPLSDQHITLTIAGDTTTSGRSSCGDYTAHVFGAPSKLWVDPSVPHDQRCRNAALKALRDRYVAALGTVHYGTITGGILTLRAPDITLTFSRAIHVPLTLVVDRTWSIQTIALDAATTQLTIQLKAPLSASGATIAFSESGSVSGTDGCRGFNARYTENAGEIVVSGLTSSKNGCSDDDLFIDEYLMSLLSSGFAWQSANGQLTLQSTRAGVELTFVENPLRGGDLG